MTTSPNRPTDHLIEAAWHCHDAIDLGIDMLAKGDDIETDDSIELCHIADSSRPLDAALEAFTRYSDGVDRGGQVDGPPPGAPTATTPGMTARVLDIINRQTGTEA